MLPRELLASNQAVHGRPSQAGAPQDFATAEDDGRPSAAGGVCYLFRMIAHVTILGRKVIEGLRGRGRRGDRGAARKEDGAVDRRAQEFRARNFGISSAAVGVWRARNSRLPSESFACETFLAQCPLIP